MHAFQLLMVALFAACGGGGDGDRPPTTGPEGSAADFVRECGTDIGSDFDAGLEARAVAAGPVTVVPFRVAPEPKEGVRTFKVQVRTERGTSATVASMTAGTSLLFDQAKFRDDNMYALTDGASSVEFEGCAERAAVFVGAILTTGPRTVSLRVSAGGESRDVTLTAVE